MPDTRDVFAELEADRESGRLMDLLVDGEYRYQICEQYPALLMRIGQDGSRSVGVYKTGGFEVFRRLK